jgi:hypothetical protein
MGKYQNEDVARFDRQFAETPQERSEARTMARFRRTIETLQRLISDLTPYLADEGCDFGDDGLADLRQRAANALPVNKCPDWLWRYRDPPIVKG